MDYLIALPIIIIFITTSLGVIILASNRKDIRNKTLFFIILLSALWITASFLADHSSTQTVALFWAQFAIIPPAFVLPSFLYFSLIFPAATKKYNWKVILALFIPALLYLAFFNTPFNVTNVSLQSWGTDYTPELLYKLFIPYFIIYFCITLYDFYKSYRIVGNKVAKAQISFVVLGLLSAFVIGIVTNVILPLFGESKVSVLGPSFAILFLTSFNTYAILKHHLFNIKVISAELLTFAIWLFLLIQLLVANTVQARITNGILLIFVIFFGILLIRSVINETRQRERLQTLTKELETANEKLKELDKLKTEFLGLASHQVRSPLTAIKGASSMLLEGSFGKLANEYQQIEIDHIFQSSNNLIRVIEDLLDVSKIEQGGMKFEMQPVDILKVIRELIGELTLSAKQKGLILSFELRDTSNYIIKADQVKIRQVLLNLIDNAIKYTQKGYVKVILSKPEKEKILIAVTDSGMGISKENINKLFEKFSRVEGSKVNTGGSGLGLYLAKEIVLAHGGKIWLESPGLGKGTTFNVELPEK